MKIYRIIFFISVVFFLSCSDSREISVDKPNIVWITSEDNSVHYMRLFDSEGIETPQIEQLALEGVKFTHAFSNAPVCSVARSTLITGCYAPRLFGNFHRKIKPVVLPDSIKMFPTYLRRAGYYTANNAKEDYNYIKTDSVWNVSSPSASWKSRSGNQPFFYVHNIHISHEGQLHFNDTLISRGLDGVDIDTVSVQPNHPDSEIFRFTKAYYQNRIQKMDDEVGQVVASLEKDDLMENTIIFYFGDHGGVLPGSKGYLYETGLHIPLVVYIPEKYRDDLGVTAGIENSGFVSFVDFGATVLKLAGQEIPRKMDGKPFLGLGVDMDEVQQRDLTFGYADRFDEKYDMVRSVRKGAYKYIRSYQPFFVDGLMNNYRYKQLAYQDWWHKFISDDLNDVQARFFKPRRPEMLFNIEDDPYEINDLSENIEFKNELEDLRAELDGWIMEMPDLSFFPEYELINSAAEDPIEFGRRKKEQIQRYHEIANLALKKGNSAIERLQQALSSADPFDRYWAINTAMGMRLNSHRILKLISGILNDDIPLNQIAAAAYLKMDGEDNLSSRIVEILHEATYPAELLMMLNYVVLLRDFHNMDIEIDFDAFPNDIIGNDEVQRRIYYLSS